MKLVREQINERLRNEINNQIREYVFPLPDRIFNEILDAEISLHKNAEHAKLQIIEQLNKML